MAEPNDVNVDELKRRARRRLVGAVVLALGAAVFVPMLLESDPKPLGEDVSVKIPPVDDGKFVNRLSDKGKIEPPRTPGKGEPAKVEAPKAEPPKSEPSRADAAPVPSAKDGAGTESPSRDSAAKEGTKEPAAREAIAKDPTAKDSAAKDSSKDSISKDSVAKDSAVKDAAPASPAKSSLGDAERKMLNATSKPAPASSVPTKTSGPAAAPAVPPAPPSGATPKADGAPGFSVQLAAFADDKGANALSNKLKKSGYPAYTEPLTTSKGTLWRVRVGPFASRDAAASSRDKLKGEGYSGIVAPAN